MPKMNNLTRRKERRSRQNDGRLVFRESPLAPSASLFVSPRKVSNEDMHETSLRCNVVTPPTSLTKFNEDGTYRMEVALSPGQRRTQRSPRLLRSCSSTSSSSSSVSSASSATRSLKRSSGSLKRCLVDLADLVTEDASHIPPDPTDECASENSLQVREVVSPSADSSNWGHFIDEIPVDEHRPSFLHFPKPQKRRRIIKSRHDKPLKGYFLASVDEAAKELDSLRF